MTWSLIAQDATHGPIAIQTGTEQEIRDAYRAAMRNLTTYGVGGYYAREIEDFAVGHPDYAKRERTAEEASVANALMAQMELL